MELRKVVQIGRIRPWRLWRMERHRHEEFHQLICVRSGVLHIRVDGGGELQACAGQLAVYPAGQWHEEWADGSRPPETIFLGFMGHAGKEVRTLEDRYGRVGGLMDWLETDRERGEVEGHVQILSLMNMELSKLGKVASDGAMGLRLDAYMREKLAGRVSCSELAAVAGLSLSHFIRSYRRSFGKTPMRQLKHLRMMRAKGLVLNSSLPLKEVAHQCGLANEYHLSREFRVWFGVAPSTLRRRTDGVLA